MTRRPVVCRPAALVLGAAHALAAATAAAAPPAPATPIVWAGDPAPGGAGEAFSSSTFGLVNDAGSVAISARLGSGATSPGLWRWDAAVGGTPAPLVLPGPPPVPAGAAQIASAFAREITASGRIGYEASFAVGVGGVTALTQKAYFSWDPGAGHALVARSGDPAPGFSDHRLLLGLSADLVPDWNGAGQVIFSAAAIPPTVTFPLNQGAFYRFDPAAGLAPLFAYGDAAPGDPGQHLSLPIIFRLDDEGRIAFATGVFTSPGDLGQTGLFETTAGGALAQVARIGAEAPGVPGSVLGWIPGGGFFGFGGGRLAFAGQMASGPGGVTSFDDWGVWIADDPSHVALVARSGQSVPSAQGLVFRSFDTPAVSDAGRILFTASLRRVGGVTGFDDNVLIGSDAAGSLHLIAREGDASAVVPGELWGSFSGRGDPIASDGGIFFSTSTGIGTTRLVYRDPGGAFHLVAGEGLPVDFGAGDVRTLQTLIDWDSSEGLTRYAITARFADGSSGLFLVSIPEPASALLVALGLAGLAMLSGPRRQRDRKRSRPHAAAGSAGRQKRSRSSHALDRERDQRDRHGRKRDAGTPAQPALLEEPRRARTPRVARRPRRDHRVPEDPPRRRGARAPAREARPPGVALGTYRRGRVRPRRAHGCEHRGRDPRRDGRASDPGRASDRDQGRPCRHRTPAGTCAGADRLKGNQLWYQAATLRHLRLEPVPSQVWRGRLPSRHARLQPLRRRTRSAI